MRFIEVGTDQSGRSTVLREVPIDGVPSVVSEEPVRTGGSSMLWSFPGGPHPLERPTVPGAIDAGCAPGALAWKLWAAAPGLIAGLHRTDTIDCNIVLSGDMVLLLDAGEIEMGPGDCVVLPGAAHGWRSGPQGAVVAVMQLGLDPIGA